MPLLSKASNVVQNVSFLYDVTGFTQIGHSIPVATNCTILSLFQNKVLDLIKSWYMYSWLRQESNGQFE